MIPILFPSDELLFRSNGIGRLTDAVDCAVTEERNGIFELELSYPITGKWYQTMIDEGGIIYATHDETKKPQPFDIYDSTKPINGIVVFRARHISYRLRNTILFPFAALGPAAAFDYIQKNQRGADRFTFSTDLVSAVPFVSKNPESARALLCGQEGSILDVYGGECQFDRFDVKLLQSRGQASGVEIRYGKNLLDIEDETDEGSCYGAIAPYWSNGEESVYLPELYVVSPELPARSADWTTEAGEQITDGGGNVLTFAYVDADPVPMVFSSDFQEAPSAEELRAAALAYLSANKPWLPERNIRLDFLRLASTLDAAEIEQLQKLCLCDTVSVFYPALGVAIRDEQVIRTVYDTLTERYREIELGRLQPTIIQTAQQQTVESLGDVIEAINGKPSEAEVSEKIDEATELLRGGLGGYVYWTLNAEGKPQELLILDAPELETAVNVIRINKNGIGFSQNGYNGPFSSAWTIDGTLNMQQINVINFVADIISGGTINADNVNVTNVNGQNIKNYTIPGEKVETGGLDNRCYASGSVSTSTCDATIQGYFADVIETNKLYAGTGQVNFLTAGYVRADRWCFSASGGATHQLQFNGAGNPITAVN